MTKFLLVLGLLFISCKKELIANNIIDLKNVNEIKVFKGYPEVEMNLSDSDLNTLKKELVLLKSIKGPIKYAKPYKLILIYNNKVSDTIFTNGKIFRLKKHYFESEQNLIKTLILTI